MKTFEYQGFKIAYRDHGSGPAVLFVHGTPSSSAEFTEVIDALSTGYRCIAIDMLGFGESDKPAMGDYSTTAQAARLGALLDHLHVGTFHLVAHDFGGPISLMMARQRWERVLSLTLMNTWAWPLVETEPAMKRQLPLLRSRLMRWMYRRFNLSARVLVKAAWGKHRRLTSSKHSTYLAAFPTSSSREGTVAFLSALTNFQDPAWQVGTWAKEASVKPTLLLWGGADPMITQTTLARWQELLPQASVAVLDGVGHFVADEAPELVVQELREHLGRAAAGAADLTGLAGQATH